MFYTGKNEKNHGIVVWEIKFMKIINIFKKLFWKINYVSSAKDKIIWWKQNILKIIMFFEVHIFYYKQRTWF